MISDVLKNMGRFILLVLLQVLIVKNINLGRYFIFFPYVLFILLLPFNTSKPLALLIAFVLGLTIDMFYDTQGMHASACLVMAFARNSVLELFAPREGYDEQLKPTITYMGIGWYSSYAIVLILIHHFVLFYIEAFTFQEFFRTLLRVVCSTFATFGFIYLMQFLFYRPSTNRLK
jgi:hypothetical protein